MHLARFAIMACCLSFAACAHAIVTPTVVASKPAADALLVLPGFGYDRAGERAFRSLAPSLASEGIDLYLPTFISRSGLDESRERLDRFVRENRLHRYERLHVFAFIAGGWTLNPLAEAGALPNLTTVVYDRSPYQERAPGIAMEKLPFLTWVRHGPVVFDMARTPYAPLTARHVRVGLAVETTPTSFIRRFARSAKQPGPDDFACDAFGQRHDDCMYVAMNHDEVYARFGDLWPDVRAFIRTGRFTPSAIRTPPAAALLRAEEPVNQSPVTSAWLPPSAFPRSSSAERRRLSAGWSGGRSDTRGVLPAKAGSHRVFIHKLKASARVQPSAW